MSDVLGQVSAPSPREMYEADPEGPPNLYSYFSLDSLDTTETLKPGRLLSPGIYQKSQAATGRERAHERPTPTCVAVGMCCHATPLCQNQLVPGGIPTGKRNEDVRAGECLE